GRAPAALRRSADAPASPFAPRLADRLATAQRSRFHLTGLCSRLDDSDWDAGAFPLHTMGSM
ncbi:MAG: hypothetical protein V3U18_00720, partial [Alphaproteobacteria bacterium]